MRHRTRVPVVGQRPGGRLSECDDGLRHPVTNDCEWIPRAAPSTRHPQAEDNMKRIAIGILAIIGMTAPAISEHSPSQQLDRAQYQVRQMDREIDQIRNPHIRAQLEDRVRRLDRLLNRIEASGALEERHRDHRGHGRHHNARHALDFNDMKQVIERQYWDSEKLEAVQRMAPEARLTTMEARALAASMTFDSERAEALIALYPSVVDKHRFRAAFDILTFDSSKRRVARQIGA